MSVVEVALGAGGARGEGSAKRRAGQWLRLGAVWLGGGLGARCGWAVTWARGARFGWAVASARDGRWARGEDSAKWRAASGG